MSGGKYHERLADALRSRLGDGIEVYADSSVVSMRDPRTRASALAWVPGGDHRSGPFAGDVSDVIRSAASRLRGDIPKYRSEFVEPGRAFAALLQDNADHWPFRAPCGDDFTTRQDSTDHVYHCGHCAGALEALEAELLLAEDDATPTLADLAGLS